MTAEGVESRLAQYKILADSATTLTINTLRGRQHLSEAEISLGSRASSEMKHIMKVAVLVSSVICLASARTNITSSLSYDCTNNNTIRVYAKNVTASGSMHATDENNNQCNVQRTNRNNTEVIFVISGCNVSQPIRVTVMSDTQNMSRNMVLGGRIHESDELQCNGMLVGGVKVQESFHINETGSTPNFIQRPQESYNLKLEIQKEAGSPLLDNEIVRIGDKLKLSISVQNGFQIFVDSCNATDKAVKGNHTKTLVSHGCTSDKEVLGNFTLIKNPNKVEVAAELYAFHFIDTHYITIECEIIVCESDDKDCSFNVILPPLRRRRNTVPLEQTMTVSTTLKVLDRLQEKDENSKISAGQRGLENGFVLMIICAMLSATRNM